MPGWNPAQLGLFCRCHPGAAPEMREIHSLPRKRGLAARIQNAAVFLGLHIWYLHGQGGMGGAGKASSQMWFANPWNAISAGVGSQHSSWLELCLEWIFLNESFKQKPWNTQNSSGVQWIGSFIQILSKTPSTSTVSGTFSSDYLFPPTLSAVSISKELLDHSYFFKGYFTCVYWLKYIVILHKIPGFGTFFSLLH